MRPSHLLALLVVGCGASSSGRGAATTTADPDPPPSVAPSAPTPEVRGSDAGDAGRAPRPDFDPELVEACLPTEPEPPPCHHAERPPGGVLVLDEEVVVDEEPVVREPFCRAGGTAPSPPSQAVADAVSTLVERDLSRHARPCAIRATDALAAAGGGAVAWVRITVRGGGPTSVAVLRSALPPELDRCLESFTQPLEAPLEGAATYVTRVFFCAESGG